MAESSHKQGTRRRRRAAIVAGVILASVTASAYAATITERPSISGNPAPGSELTASTGAWTPGTTPGEYVWLRCNASGAACLGISGACGRRYQVRTADEGHRLRVRLTVDDGQPATADSDATQEIKALPYQETVLGNDTCVKVATQQPGQGTFTSGEQTGGGSTPAPDTSLKFIDPFPVVRVAGRFKGKRTTLTRVTVKTPRGTRLRSTCDGRSCPWRRRAIAARTIRIRSLQRAYRPKTTIEIRVTQAKKIGKYTRIRTRRGKAPTRVDRCLMPGKKTPVRCPES